LTDELLNILQRALQVFKRYGVKTVTMDDIARELGISKKTLYRYVSDKNDLLLRTASLSCSEEEDVMGKIREESNDAIDEMLRTSRFVSEVVAQINPVIVYDLQRYYPEVWQTMDKHRIGFVGETIKTNIERGKAEGVYRSDFNTEIVVKLYLAQTYAMTDVQLFPFPKFEVANIYNASMNYHIHAICSPKGIALYQQYMQDFENSKK